MRNLLASFYEPRPVRRFFTGAQIWGLPWFGTEAIDPKLQENGQAKAAEDLEHVRRRLPPRRGS